MRLSDGSTPSSWGTKSIPEWDLVGESQPPLQRLIWSSEKGELETKDDFFFFTNSRGQGEGKVDDQLTNTSNGDNYSPSGAG